MVGRNPKVLVGEIDGEELPVSSEYTLPSTDIPFDNSTNGFISNDVQTAIEEAATTGSVNDSDFDKILTGYNTLEVLVDCQGNVLSEA